MADGRVHGDRIKAELSYKSKHELLPQIAPAATLFGMGEEHDGMRLARLMRRAGVKDKQIAEAADVSVQAVGQWRKNGGFSREQIVPICRALRASADELLGLVSISGVMEDPAFYNTGAGHRRYNRARMADAVRTASRHFDAHPEIDNPDNRVTLTLALYDALEIDIDIDKALRFISGTLPAGEVRSS